MFLSLQKSVKNAQHDLNIFFMCMRRSFAYTAGYDPFFHTNQFRELLKENRYFSRLRRNDQLEFLSFWQELEIRLLYLQVSDEKITRITHGLSNILKFILHLPKKYLIHLPKILNASGSLDRLESLGGAEGICSQENIRVPDESAENILNVMRSYKALANEFSVAVQDCNPVEQNHATMTYEQFVQELQQNRNAEAKRDQLRLFVHLWYSTLIVAAVEIVVFKKESFILPKEYDFVFLVIFGVCGLMLFVELVWHMLDPIKSARYQDRSLLLFLEFLSDKIASTNTWRDFHKRPDLKPQDSSELAEKIFFIGSSKYALEGVSTVVKNYLLEDKTFDSSTFNTDSFVRVLEEEYVNGGQYQLRAMYNEDTLTHDLLVEEVTKAVADLRHSKRESLLAEFGVFKPAADGLPSGLRHRNETLTTMNINS